MEKDRLDNEYRAALGRCIRDLRTSQGLSLRTFGKMIGVDYQHVMNVENGKCGVTIDVLYRIASGLGVRVKDLISF